MYQPLTLKEAHFMAFKLMLQSLENTETEETNALDEFAEELAEYQNSL